MHIVPTLEQIKKFATRQLVLQLVCVGIVVLIVWNFISAVTLFSGLDNTLKQHENETQNTLIEHERIANGAPKTLNYKFFGDYVPQNLDAAGVRQSMLNLTVVGVLFAEIEEDSQVMLKSPDGQEKFFHIGDELSGGGVIKRITEEGVLISRDGMLERLSLPKQELKFEAPIKLDNED